MITIYSIKPQFQKALRPVLGFLAKRGVTPNQVTVFTAILSIVCGLYLCSGAASLQSFWVLPILLLVRMALNAIDGLLARNYQMQTRIGTYLNEMGDIVSDFFLYLPFAIKLPSSQGLIGAIIFLSLLSEVAGILAVSVGAERRYDGPMGKSDRAFCFGIMALLLSLGLMNSLWTHICLVTVLTLLFVTIYLRVKNGLKVRN